MIGDNERLGEKMTHSVLFSGTKFLSLRSEPHAHARRLRAMEYGASRPLFPSRPLPALVFGQQVGGKAVQQEKFAMALAF